VVLAEDETLWRLFPPLRYAWAPLGQVAVVPITGRNAKRSLFGAIELKSAQRLLLPRLTQRQDAFQDFLRHLRDTYAGVPIYLLLDENPSHTAGRSLILADQLGIELLWLPKQCPELNPMDQLWKELKKDMAANYQYKTIEQGVRYAVAWLGSLTKHETLKKAGLLSANSWLRAI
jgi:transposase